MQAMIDRATDAPVQARSIDAGYRGVVEAANLANPRGAIQRKSVQAPIEPGAVDAQVALPSSGGGRPLPSPVLQKMESSFGASFDDVRVHEGQQAGALNALAFTHGHEIHFAPGRYQPESIAGQELLGHELAHVVQQREGRVSTPSQAKGLAVVDDGALEREADVQGARAARGEPARSAGQHVVGNDLSGAMHLRSRNAAQPGQPGSFQGLQRSACSECGAAACKCSKSSGTPKIQRFVSQDRIHQHPPAPYIQRLGSAAVSGIAAGASATGATVTGTADRSSNDTVPTSGPGGGEAPTGTCRVDVRATHISASWMPFRHLFIVQENAAGAVTAFRGGPGGAGGTPPYGTIQGQSGPYGPGFVDWDPSAPSIRVETGPSACGKDACLASELARITGTATPYSPTGPNSNTVVRTLLHNCGLPESIPVSSLRVPGWGSPYL